MKKNDLLRHENNIYRVLGLNADAVMVIDCNKRNMPKWVKVQTLKEYELISEESLKDCCHIEFLELDNIDLDSQRFMYEHYTYIANILPCVADDTMRKTEITNAAQQYNVTKQTIRKYLCLYLIFQDIRALLPKPHMEHKKELTQDEKNMRWSLNKFFYNKNNNSLHTAYTMMLKNRYCDGEGKLLESYPSFYQYRYFYRKTRKLQNYYISRDGLKNYQRNNRPLLGDGVQEYANAVGVGMIDATVCDIYLINESGDLVGRPILTACVDAFSGLCCGYSLSWEGGVYSLRNLMLNIITDKVEHCKKFGIEIQDNQWASNMMPGKLVSDKGTEYVSDTFAQIAELGVSLVNLPAYRPELKGWVEKFFDLVQDTYKPHLKGKGVIEPDYMERGAHDYRKDACLSMEQFEKIILRCIIFHNSKRVLEDYPYTKEMIKADVKPHPMDIWSWGMQQPGANLIPISNEKLVLTLLPRTIGRYSRFGLKVNKLRYHHENYVEKYLKGIEVEVSYNPEDVSCVWVHENGCYIRFDLIDSRFKDMTYDDVEILRKNQRKLNKAVLKDKTQAEIELAEHIEVIANGAKKSERISIKSVRDTRKKEAHKSHIDYVRGIVSDEQ